MVRRVREIAAKYRLEIPLFGHIGDGIMNPGKIFPDPGGIDTFRL
jgi:hypothetical protein